MKIQRFSPSVVLFPFIKEYIIIEAEEALNTNTIPDTSMVMAFRYRGNVLKSEGDKSEAVPASVSSGLRKSARQFNYLRNTANLLVILKEGGFAALSKIPAHELFSVSVSNENIFPQDEVSEILETLAEATSDRLRIRSIENFLTKKLLHQKADALVARALELIKEQNGVVRIKDLARTLNISQDPFEKRFRTIVGTSPKQYASITRLRTLIQKYPSYTSLTAAAHDAGYFDQSHFIKDFRLFTGKAPKEFLKGGEFW